MKRITAAAIFAALAGGTLAHGDAPHASKAVDYSQAEETPFGRAADPRKAKRTVRVDMTDAMRFHPAAIKVRQDEVVRFVPTNKGQLMHEMVLGTMGDLKKHAELMRKHPEMEHDEPHMAHVAPGKSGEIGWQFTKPGEFYYGCLVPGHFEAGMVGKVVVAANRANAAEPQQKPIAGTAAQGPLTTGEVRKVDKDAQKITIRHGAIENLDMPAHTMVFQVQDPAVLDQVKVGDKVKFRAEKIGGQFTVTKLERAE